MSFAISILSNDLVVIIIDSFMEIVFAIFVAIIIATISIIIAATTNTICYAIIAVDNERICFILLMECTDHQRSYIVVIIDC